MCSCHRSLKTNICNSTLPCLHNCFLRVLIEMAFPSLVAFGGIAPWPGTDRLDQLRTTLHQQSSLKSFVRVIQELPLLWKTLVRQDPSIHSITGNTAAEALSQWITGGAITQTVHDLGNVIRMPLTTIAQIAQYISYLRQRGDPYAHEAIIKNAILGGGIQGLCIGLLSALAVASGKTEDEIGSFAATSVKLAFCIGAYVDLDAHRSKDESNPSTMAVRWKAPTTLEDIQHLASRHPNVSLFARLNEPASSNNSQIWRGNWRQF